MTEIIVTESSQDELASDDDFLLYESPKKNLTRLLKVLEFPQLIPTELPNSHASNAKGKLKNVLNMYKENISAAYVSDTEIEKPPPIYDRDTKNKAEELDILHAAVREKLVNASNTEKLQILTLIPDSWSPKYCCEYFRVSGYIIPFARELKQRKGILAQPSQKKIKQWLKKQLILFMLSMRMTNTADSFPGKRIT